MLRAKSRRQPRGVLVVPVLKEDALGKKEPELEETASAEIEAGAVAVDEEPTEDRATTVTPEAPPVEAAPASPGGPDLVRRLRPFARPAGFVVLLVALGLVGLLVGRALRDGGETEAASTTAAVSTAPARKPAPVPASKPTSESWGPLTATPSGKLARPAVAAAAALADQRVIVLGGSASDAVQAGAPGGPLRATASLPSRRAGAAAFAAGGAVYLIGGEQGAGPPTDEILRYDLAKRTVTSAGRFVEPLAGAGYAQSGDAMYLVGGWTGEKYATAVLRFTLPGSSAVVARLPEATRDPAVALHRGTLYVAGGRTVEGFSNVVYAVDLATGGVSVFGFLPRPVSGGVLVAAGGKLYLLGGRDKAGPVRTVVEIDPAGSRITSAGTMPRPLAGAVVLRAGGGATYVVGGTRPTAVTRIDAS
jgi:hypothetical protein